MKFYTGVVEGKPIVYLEVESENELPEKTDNVKIIRNLYLFNNATALLHIVIYDRKDEPYSVEIVLPPDKNSIEFIEALGRSPMLLVFGKNGKPLKTVLCPAKMNVEKILEHISRLLIKSK